MPLESVANDYKLLSEQNAIEQNICICSQKVSRRNRRESHAVQLLCFLHTRALGPVPTQQSQDAGQDGDQGPGAEAGGQHVGLSVAGLGDPVGVTVAHADGQGVGAAERRRSTVHDEDGQIVNGLFLSPEAIPPGEN